MTSKSVKKDAQHYLSVGTHKWKAQSDLTICLLQGPKWRLTISTVVKKDEQAALTTGENAKY